LAHGNGGHDLMPAYSSHPPWDRKKPAAGNQHSIDATPKLPTERPNFAAYHAGVPVEACHRQALELTAGLRLNEFLNPPHIPTPRFSGTEVSIRHFRYLSKNRAPAPRTVEEDDGIATFLVRTPGVLPGVGIVAVHARPFLPIAR